MNYRTGKKNESTLVYFYDEQMQKIKKERFGTGQKEDGDTKEIKISCYIKTGEDLAYRLWILRNN